MTEYFADKPHYEAMPWRAHADFASHGYARLGLMNTTVAQPPDFSRGVMGFSESGRDGTVIRTPKLVGIAAKRIKFSSMDPAARQPQIVSPSD